MAKKNLANLSDKELVELNNELSTKRAVAVEEIKSEQLEVNAELSRRQLRARLGNLSREERAALSDLIAEDDEEDANNG